jgi:LmbE family N-acetylglucosaminyl deacetylase
LKSVAIAASLIALSFFFNQAALAQFPPAPGTGPGLAETIEAIDAARVSTRILYITAHPDDESGAVLTYLARGLHADVALLSLTHGEGGQNALGPEQAPQLGLIRTQELLAATRGYGVKLYFTRAKDFGFSKTPEETEKIWGDQVQEDMVRVIRTFRPNIVINNWGGVHTGHGHHQASGILTPKAVAAAIDKSFCKECGPTWKVDQILDLERGSEHPKGYLLPLDDVSPLWGKTWREIGLDAFASHRTQGITVFLGSPFLRRPIALIPEGGGPFDPRSLARLLHTSAQEANGEDCRPNNRFCSSLEKYEEKLAEAKSAALALDWEKSSQALDGAADQLRMVLEMGGSLSDRRMLSEIEDVLPRFSHAIILANGVEINAVADRANVVAGDQFLSTVTVRCRMKATCEGTSTKMILPKDWVETKRTTSADGGTQFTIVAGPSNGARDAWDALLPNGRSALTASVAFSTEPYSPPVVVPITHVEATSTRVDSVPLRIVPAYTLAVEPKQEVEVLAKKRKPFDVFLRVHSYSSKPSSVTVGLDVPSGWKVSAAASLDFSGEGDKYAKFTVTQPSKLTAGNYTIAAYAKRGDEQFSTTLEPLPSIPTILWSEPAECRVHAFDVSVPENLRVGYITSEGEPVPEALQRLGIHVEMLDAAALNFSELGNFDAIVVGVRAYELRPELPGANQRLLDYVSNGGTLVVEYQRDFAWDKSQFAPYPAKIDPGKPGAPLPRITDEDAPVKLLKSDDPLLSQPNKIAQADFSGWVQERGLYFWSQFDDRYTPLLAMNDPGEPDLNGGLVYTRYGKGTYIYTGIAFFRQLPEGVPGAYRLFVNLLAASQKH